DANIAVTGGGSGTGIAALLNGTADIATASRKIKAKELELAKKKELDIREHTVARDGIAVIVNLKNPASDLSLEQLKKIYVGAYTKWKQVGGPNKKIVLTGRNTASGTYVFFNKKVCEKEDYSQKMMNLASNSAIVQIVSQDKWAIGYVGLGYLAKNKNKIKGLKVEGVAPSQETVVDDSYVINRPLFFYTVGKPQGRTKQYLDLILSETGQQVVTQAGFVAIK
ncbi:PstS family phosphate ABC transporter substrate-binding protein, partial [bacterium]|nr:PstS family phosphate ABC transporter substrate-binding protein [bacterium]